MSAPKHMGGDKWFTYIAPKGKRATEYEELTLYVQPEPKNWQWQGWLTRFPDGRPPWVVESTALRCEDWFRFRDPSAMWQRPYVAFQAARVSHLEAMMRTAASRGVFESFSERWVGILEKYLQACAHPEYGLFRAFAYAQREALSDSLGNALTYNSSDKVRYAQDLAIYGMELAGARAGFSETAGKETWLNDPLLQGAREVVERIMALSDWGEITVASNLLFEPLWGSLIRAEFFMGVAPHNGDATTPMLAETAESDLDRNVRWTKSFLQLVLDDQTNGSANREILLEWLARWRPLVDRACRELAPLFDLAPVRPLEFAAAYGRVSTRAEAVLAQFGLSSAALSS
ncbi:MAG: toluene hydroxylase [Candidatus Binatia bacterium]